MNDKDTDEHEYLVFDLQKLLQEHIGKDGWELVKYNPGQLIFRRLKN